MNYEPLLSMINIQFRPDNLRSSIDQLQEHRQLIIASQEEINSELRSIGPGHNSPTVVQHHQEMLIQLSNNIYYYNKLLNGGLPQDNELKQFYAEVAAGFDDQLNFIMKNHQNYLLPDLPVPYSYTSIIRTEFEQTIQELQDAAHEKEIEAPLLDLILRPIKEIIQYKENRVTQGSVFYCRTLLHELIWLANSTSIKKQINEQIHYILLHLNFNSFEYYFFCTNKLRQKLQEKETRAERIEFLTWYEKEISTTHFRSPEIVLHKDQQSLNTQMLSWIAKEKKYVELLHDSGQNEIIQKYTEQQENMAVKEKKQENINSTKFTKLNTSLTVHELAFMVRLYIDEGIITNTSTTKVMTFITRMLTTKKTHEVAKASFKTKFYNPRIETLATCKRLLKKLQDRIYYYENKKPS